MGGQRATVAAVDLGASSGRVAVARLDGDLDGDQVVLREVHRFPNTPVSTGGVLRWDVRALYQGAVDGLRKATEACGELDAVGVDSWAVDYGLFDADGRLLADPAHYRDPRTGPVVARVLDEVGRWDLYA